MDLFELRADKKLMAALASCASREIVREEGQSIFEKGQAPRGIFLVKSGAVKVFLESDVGQALMVRVATTNSILGVPATMTKQPYSLTAQAITRTELLQVSLEDFRGLMRRDAALAVQLLALLGNEVRSARNQIASIPQRHPGQTRKAAITAQRVCERKTQYSP